MLVFKETFVLKADEMFHVKGRKRVAEGRRDSAKRNRQDTSSKFMELNSFKAHTIWDRL